MAVVIGVVEARPGAEAIDAEPGASDSVGAKRSLGTAKARTVITDAVTIHVKTVLDIEVRSGLELRNAGESPVICDVAFFLLATFGVPHWRHKDVTEHETLTVIVR